MQAFELIPAIDLYQRQVIRLHQGDYAQRTVYSSDPVGLVHQWYQGGMQRLHLVDLQGAEDPNHRQVDLLKEMADQCPNLSIQCGGGIRTEEDIASLLNAAIDRVVVGSVAVKDPALFEQWVLRFGADRFVLAADAKVDAAMASTVHIHGWQEASQKSVEQLCAWAINIGVQHLLVTDISRDGAMRGPNVSWYKHLVSQFPNLHFIASGGVSNDADLQALRETGVVGAVSGRALLEGKITVPFLSGNMA